MKDEVRKKDARKRMLSKSLEAIQVEERAMRELRTLYNADDNEEEFISVSRSCVDEC